MKIDGSWSDRQMALIVIGSQLFCLDFVCVRRRRGGRKGREDEGCISTEVLHWLMVEKEGSVVSSYLRWRRHITLWLIGRFRSTIHLLLSSVIIIIIIIIIVFLSIILSVIIPDFSFCFIASFLLAQQWNLCETTTTTEASVGRSDWLSVRHPRRHSRFTIRSTQSNDGTKTLKLATASRDARTHPTISETQNSYASLPRRQGTSFAATTQKRLYNRV